MGDLADSVDCVAYLRPLLAQLLLIGDMLPFAASADAEMPTLRFYAHIRATHHALDMAFGITMLLAVKFYVGDIAGRTVWDKYDDGGLIFGAKLDLCDRFSFGGESCNLYFMERRKLLAFTCHWIVMFSTAKLIKTYDIAVIPSAAK